jgi:hypothetical protein
MRSPADTLRPHPFEDGRCAVTEETTFRVPIEH